MEEILKTLNAAKVSVQEGESCPLLFLAEIKQIADCIEEMRSEIMDSAIKELQNSLDGKEKSYSKHGFEFAVSQSGRYSYKHFSGWNNLEEQKKEIEKNMQAAFKLNHEIVDPETGEVFPMAEYTASKQSITIKKSKK